jgi:cell division septation protein DedD
MRRLLECPRGQRHSLSALARVILARIAQRRDRGRGDAVLPRDLCRHPHGQRRGVLLQGAGSETVPLRRRVERRLPERQRRRSSDRRLLLATACQTRRVPQT